MSETESAGLVAFTMKMALIYFVRLVYAAKEAYEMLSDADKRAAYDQYGHAGVDPNMRGGGPGPEGFGGFAEAFGDIFGDIFGQGRAAAAAAAAGSLPRQRPVVCDGGHAGRSGRGKEAQIRIPSWVVRDLPRQRRQARHASQDLQHLPRPGRRADAPGLLLGAADVPALPRHRQDHSRALPHLPRPGQGQEAEDARSEDPRRHRRRHAHPQRRQRRARHQRRAAGRPVHRDPAEEARDLRARWRRPALRGADLFTRAALGGEIEVPTLAGKAAIDIPEGTQAGKQFRLRGKGIKGVRSSYPGDLYCHVAVETPVSSPNSNASC